MYIFAAAIGAAVGAITFFVLQATVLEAALAGGLVFVLCVTVIERIVRARTIARLERSVQDLSRLLSTNAQAGQTLSKRIGSLESIETATRLDVVEADVSVLGTVVRQLAETVSDIEDAQGHVTFAQVAEPQAETSFEEVPEEEPEDSLAPDLDLLEPVIPIEMLREAIAEGRLLYYVQPIVTAPDRKTFGYDLVPHLLLEDGEVAGPEDFMPTEGYGDVLRIIENGAMHQAIAFVRRARTAGIASKIFVPLSRASLGNAASVHQLEAQLEANEAITGDIGLLVSESDWDHLRSQEDKALELLAKKGARFSIHSTSNLRLSYASIQELGVTTVRVNAAKLVSDPEGLTDLHIADVAPYLKRFDMELIVTQVTNDQHILTCIDDGISLLSGPHLGQPGPIRDDLASGPTIPSAKTAIN